MFHDNTLRNRIERPAQRQIWVENPAGGLAIEIVFAVSAPENISVVPELASRKSVVFENRRGAQLGKALGVAALTQVIELDAPVHSLESRDRDRILERRENSSRSRGPEEE